MSKNVLGNRNQKVSTVVGGRAGKNNLYGLSENFIKTVNAIEESTTYNLFAEPSKVLRNEAAKEELKDLFISAFLQEGSSEILVDANDRREQAEALFENNIKALLEFAPTGAFNPILGMTFPIHQNLLMNNIYDQGVINKAVTTTPKITTSIEIRELVSVDGTVTDLYKGQKNIFAEMSKTAPLTKLVLTLPENATTDVLDLIGGTAQDNIAIDAEIVGVKFAGETAFTKVKISTLPAFNAGGYDRQFMADVYNSTKTVTERILFAMKNNRLIISAIGGLVTEVEVNVRKDTSNGLTATPTVKWRTVNTGFEVPPAKAPLNITVSPDEVKDIAALYNVDQLSKIMSMIKDVLSNTKDGDIKQFLDGSFDRLTLDAEKIEYNFDFKPTNGYALDFVTYLDAVFMTSFDSYVTQMLKFLNDPNMIVSIVGRDDLIRRISPKKFDFVSPQNVGAIELEYSQTVQATGNRIYNFVADQKEDSDDLRILLNPRNSDRHIYRTYDYQLYVSNDIRNAANPTLPAVHAYERYLLTEYQPVQGKVTILNPRGI